MSDFTESTARDDFNKARTQELFTRILNSLSPQNQELLSLNEVREVLRPRGERYKGMRTVPVDRIVGSEGRYRDFNKGFLPRREALRGRWTSIDKAHLRQVNLPAIRLYEIGGVYFVRDGNHRVSVARAQGVAFIDAEVTALDSELTIDPKWTRSEVRQAVIAYERQRFYERTRFRENVPNHDLDFSTTGRFEEIEEHIYGHKYFINQHYNSELSLDQAIVSWYNNVYKPIVDIIQEERILSRFPGRTPGDLYLWIVKHWHQLKMQYGQDFPLHEAARDFSTKYGKNLFDYVWKGVRRLVRRWLPGKNSPDASTSGEQHAVAEPDNERTP
jgi:hypothetical protein